MDSKIKKCCPNCSQLFYIKTLSPTPNGNIPLFLTCGHSMCQNCISNILKFLEPIECKICHQDMEVNASDIGLLSQGKIRLYDMFPVNMYMLGELTLQTMENADKKNIKCTEDPYLDLHALLKSVDDTQGKCLECHHPTSKMCQQCGFILCDSCFNKSHKNFIIFKNHVLQEIDTLSEKNTCLLHQDKPLEYYCKDCLKSICMDCLVVGGDKSCKNHNVVSMLEVKQNFLEELCDISPVVDETFRRLTKTAVDIGHLLYNMDNEAGSASEFNQIMAMVEQHFSRLFSFLQEHKISIIGDINKLKCSERMSLIKAKEAVVEAIKGARSVMKTIHMTSNKQKLKKINLPLLLENAKKVAETPWLLGHDETSSTPLKVSVNEEVCNMISDYVRLDAKPSGSYRLRSTAELGDDANIPPPPPAPVYPPEIPKDVRLNDNKSKEEKNWAKTPAFFKSAPKYHSKNASHTSLNSIGSESSNKSYGTQGDTYQKLVVQPVSPFTESQHPKQLHEGSQELIYVSHIVDPHNFYVQRACHQSLVKEMLREFRNAISLPKPSLNHVTEGKVYLALNKADNLWQRCRIVSIDRNNVNNPLFQVFCVDFGSTETVTIDKLRLLAPARLQSPYPLAIKCCLANCEPITGAWTSDDSILIQNIIDNKQAVIHVRKIRSTNNFSVTLECDVVTYEGGVSIAHALVFHERAKMPNPTLQYPTMPGLTKIPKLFSSNSDFKPKAIEEVYITHVISPDKFFVRKRHLQSVYEKLTEDLEQEYNLSVNTGSVYLPKKGMVYAVNIDKCCLGESAGAWARGVVEERPGRGRVRLLLPDVGAGVLVHWSALRQLHAKFTTSSALATECHLAGVTPLQKKWSPGSVALLQRYCGHLLKLHVEDHTLGVTLYHHQEDDEPLCINTLMIKHKFAVSFGVFKFNKNDDTQDQVITNKSPLDKPMSKPNPQKITIMKKPVPKIKEKYLEAKDKGPLRLEAKILHYQSPSLIYVGLVHQQKTFNMLYEKMQKYYSKNKAQGKAEWKVGDRCCAVCAQSKTWRRAVILELIETDAKIFYTDFACIETLPIEKLKELTPDFEAVGHAAIKCHLSGVRPAVGEEWPSLTKEYLSELLEVYKRVFITKSGNFKNQSMPIEVWVYHTVQGGALEPNKSEWRCLNNKIIDQGLGVPDKQEMPEPTTSLEGDEDMLSFLNITGSVREWLQLEPMPMKPVVALSHTDSNRSTPQECDDNIEDECFDNTSDTIFISDWLPPEPLPNKEFTAMPTYIDNEGVIYLHDVAQQDTLDLIRKALDVRFKNPDRKAKFNKWSVGEPCIALFFLDNRFYRGRVLEVNKDASTCLIHYIDYGNEELCAFANLRKSVALYQIPVQAHKCVLNRIRPVDEQWDRQALDYIHKSIVEKQCYVKVSGEEVNGLKPIELKYNKLWINDHLVEFEMAVYTDGSKAVLRKFVPNKTSMEPEESVIVESDSGPDYIVETDESPNLSTSQDTIDNSLIGKDWNKLMEEDQLSGQFITFPDSKLPDVFQCNINIINDVNRLELSQIHTEEINQLYEEMFEQLQIQGADLNPLNGIYENKACIALFQEDNQWYRATVLQYSETKHQIKVRYVDYGNVEVLPLADVREIKEEWTKLPPSTISAKLYGVQLNKDLDTVTIANELSEHFLDKGPFNVTIITYEDSIPSVVLRNEDGELVYEKLIEKGFFIKIDDLTSSNENIPDM